MQLTLWLLNSCSIIQLVYESRFNIILQHAEIRHCTAATVCWIVHWLSGIGDIYCSIRRHWKNIDSSSNKNPLCCQENYDTSTWRSWWCRQKNTKSPQTFNNNSYDFLTAITHTEIMVAYFW